MGVDIQGERVGAAVLSKLLGLPGLDTRYCNIIEYFNEKVYSAIILIEEWKTQLIVVTWLHFQVGKATSQFTHWNHGGWQYNDWNRLITQYDSFSMLYVNVYLFSIC